MISRSDKKIYLFLTNGLLAGLAWLAFQYGNNGMATPKGTACLFNRLTTLPCPSCGTTRAAVACLHGDFTGGISMNPAGIVLLLMMSGLIMLLVMDIISRKGLVPAAYRLIEATVRKRRVAFILIMLVLANWCRNIINGL